MIYLLYIYLCAGDLSVLLVMVYLMYLYLCGDCTRAPVIWMNNAEMLLLMQHSFFSCTIFFRVVDFY